MVDERLTWPTPEQREEAERKGMHYIAITEMVEQAGGQGSRDFGGPFEEETVGYRLETYEATRLREEKIRKMERNNKIGCWVIGVGIPTAIGVWYFIDKYLE